MPQALESQFCDRSFPRDPMRAGATGLAGKAGLGVGGSHMEDVGLASSLKITVTLASDGRWPCLAWTE